MCQRRSSRRKSTQAKKGRRMQAPPRHRMSFQRMGVSTSQKLAAVAVTPTQQVASAMLVLAVVMATAQVVGWSTRR